MAKINESFDCFPCSRSSLKAQALAPAKQLGRIDEPVSASEVLACLKQQASALERLVALSSAGMPSSTDGSAEREANVDGSDRPASAIDHDWSRLLTKAPMVVESNVIILSLEGVDTANHTFAANIVAEFHIWYAGDVREFDPKVRCMNLKENTTDPILSQYQCSDGSYCFRRQWHGVFIEHLELNNFPMDIQDLSFEFASDWPADHLKFIKSRTRESKVGGGMGMEVIRDVWCPTLISETKRDKKLAILAREDISEGAGLHSDVLHSTITFTLQVRRHAKNYLYNIIIPSATLTSLAFCSFNVPLNEVADRASITLTILLSIIAYKLIIKDELPKVNFLTLIDLYILAAMTIVAIISFANAAIGSDVETVTEELRSRDSECRLALGITWVLCNLVFVVRIMFRNHVARNRISSFKKNCNDTMYNASDVLLLV